jgi:hypothetical protein
MSKIVSADYNNVRNSMLALLGTGSGDQGYGQSPISSAVSASTKVREVQWDQLRQDIQRIADHQGTAVALTDVTTTTKIRSTIATQYQNAITNSLVPNRFNLAAGQFSDESLTSSSRSTAWNTTIVHEFNINFGSLNNARFFFNAGGSIRIRPSFTKSGATTINNDWETLIAGVGWLSLTHTTFTSSSIGYYDLTTSSQQVYTRTGGSQNATYAVNDYTILVSRNAAGSVVNFRCEFKDDKGANPNFDETVTGTVTNEARMYRPSGSNVNVTAPSAATTTNL